MASIDIPNLGTVTVNDLATEETADNILKTQRQILATMTGVKEEDSQGNVTLAQILREQKKDGIDSKTIKQQMGKYIKETPNAVMKGFETIGNKKITDVITQTMSRLGAPAAVSTAFGMANQAAEELGEVMRLSGRFGVDFTSELAMMNARTSEVGLTLGEFTKMVGQDSLAMREFGDGVQNGSMRFLKLVENFQAAAEPFGNFGMKTQEAAEFMAKELEIRRKTMDTDSFRAMNEQALAESMAENIKQQEAMARVTGQDVRSRLQAQMEMRNSAIAQSFLSEQTGDTQERFKQLASALSTIPGGKQLGEAIVNGIATDLPANAFAPELIARLGSNADKLISFVMGNIEGGMDSAQFGTEVQQLVQDLRGPAAQNANVLRTQAALGDSTALTILTFQEGLADIDDVAGKVAESLEKLNEEAGTTTGTARGLSAELQKTQAIINARLLDVARGIGRGATGDENLGTVDALMAIQKMTQEFGSTEFAETFAKGVGTALGSFAIEPFVNVAKGQMELSDKLFFAGLGAFAVGRNNLGMGLMALQGTETVMDTFASFGDETSAEQERANREGISVQQLREREAERLGVSNTGQMLLQKFGAILGSEENPTNMKFNKQGLDEFVGALTTAIKEKVDAYTNNQNPGP
tara:strand:- start:17010 stop:18932 length:1923 start_codon:yes stop_codon:yes gene_type:complete